MEQSNDDEVIIADEGDYTNKSGFDKATMCSEKFRECLKSRSCEMKEGFATLWQNPKSGKVEKIDLPDPRQVYFGNIESLRILLTPEILRNENAKKKYDAYKTDRKSIMDKYLYEELFLDSDGTLKKTGRKFIPQNGKEVVVGSTMVIQTDKSKKIIPRIATWDHYVSLMKDELVQVHDDMFETLSILIDELNYFKTGEQY